MIYSVSTPNLYELKTAYNPMIVNVFTTGVNPIVYCDVYINGSYYKTITATSASSTAFGFDYWPFDIRGVAQEYLRANPPFFAVTPSIPQVNNSGIALATVKIRGSAIVGGFVVPDGPAPVQATMDNPAASGGGTTAYGAPSWTIINAALQLEQRTNAALHLSENNVGFLSGVAQIYNLFNNPRLTIGVTDLFQLPILIPGGGLPGGPTQNLYLTILDEFGNQYYLTGSLQPYSHNSVYYLPAGPRNFAGLAALSGHPGVPNFSTIKRYRLALSTTSTSPIDIVWQSPEITIVRACGDRKRFRFVNWLGQYDVVTFEESLEDFVVTAEGWEQYNPGDFTTIGKEAFGKQRLNVRSGEVITATGYFRESDMRWIKEFLSTPRAYLETTGIDGQLDFQRAIRLLDVTATTKKIDERYIYAITIKAEYANERINIRN